ncbi:MAG TPA: hypothetical protein VGK14_08685 [Novimethylophilus sp.]|jgi:hypothetical protein|uniref:hypothetical protein n=1 Tax=Novimethylophilus sp. TaxID=2137426 RepID=UPI002F42CDC0
MPEKPPLKALVVIPAVFAVFTVVVTVVFFAWWAMRERFVFGHDAFDQVRWASSAANGSAACDRGKMVRDLRERLLRPGISKPEATMLLGRPAWEEPAQIEYELGVCQWVVHGLRLYFDSNGRLTHTAIVQH